MQHRDYPRWIDVALVDEQGAELGVAVLLDQKYLVVLGDEAQHLVSEREAAHAQSIEVDAALLQRLERLFHRRCGRAEIDRAEPRRLLRIAPDRRRHQFLRG